METMKMKDMAKLLKDVPPSDPDLTETCYTEYIENAYIIYDGKRHKAVCTRCGGEWDLYPGEYARMHGLKEECPCCGEKTILLAAGRGRQCYTEYFRVLSFAEHKGAIWGFLNEVIADFGEFGRPLLHRKLTNIYIISKYEQTRWRRHENWYGDSYFERIKSMRVPAPPHGMGGYYGFYSKYVDHVYTNGLPDMIARSDCKHLLSMLSNGSDIIAILATCMKYHSVELLAKAGFERIANAKIAGSGCRGINWRGESLERILKLPRRYVRKLREYDPNMAELEAFQSLSEQERSDISIPVLRDMLCWTEWDSKRNEYRNVYKKRVEEYMSFDKWLRWAKTQEYYMSVKTARPNLLRDYKDYISTAEKLGMDIRKKSILRPKDLNEAHDSAVNRLTIERNAAVDKLIAENSRSDTFKSRKLMIIPAMCQEDLNKESAILGHCVKTYGDKIAKGKCFIFFVRDVKAPDVPYYTLETTPEGGFVQCRGRHNCSMTDDVKLFTDAFVKTLKAEIKKERKETCQTA